MDTSVKTRQRRDKRRSARRDHARPAPSAPHRMRPRSQARPSSDVPSVTTRRAERRARKQRESMRAAPTRRRAGASYVLSWRAVSGLIVVGLSVVLYLFLTTDAFFVRSVAIGGEKYLSREEIFRFSDVAQRHVFWIDPADVETRLESVPNIADASVYVGWPPDMVQIVVVEREPALIWEQQVRVWVDVNGIVMKQREDRPDLLRVVVPNAAEPLDVGARIPQTVVDGALQLRQRYSNIDVLLYDPVKGLGYHDGRGWTVWFGTGEDMDIKLLVYNRIVEDIWDTVQPGEIVMADPDRPYYTVLWRKDGGN
jgi:hypothetical protein